MFYFLHAAAQHADVYDVFKLFPQTMCLNKTARNTVFSIGFERPVALQSSEQTRKLHLFKFFSGLRQQCYLQYFLHTAVQKVPKANISDYSNLLDEFHAQNRRRRPYI